LKADHINKHASGPLVEVSMTKVAPIVLIYLQIFFSYFSEAPRYFSGFIFNFCVHLKMGNQNRKSFIFPRARPVNPTRYTKDMRSRALCGPPASGALLLLAHLSGASLFPQSRSHAPVRARSWLTALRIQGRGIPTTTVRAPPVGPLLLSDSSALKIAAHAHPTAAPRMLCH
jgi:hypothetical protein